MENSRIYLAGAPPNERGENRQAKPTATAPHLYSTDSATVPMTGIGKLISISECLKGVAMLSLT